jgi:hypothetical protein
MKIRILILFLIAYSFANAQKTNKLDSTGNVGIGTINPLERLHVYKNISGNYNPALMIEDGLNAGFTQMSFKGTGRSYHIGVGNSSATLYGLNNKFFVWDVTAATHRMVIDISGNMGIGTNAPGNRLSIYASTANSSGLQFSRLNNTAAADASNGKVLSLDASGNVILVNDGVGSAGWSINGNSNIDPANVFLGTTDLKDLVFKTNNTERIRLSSGGSFNIGSGADKGKKFQVYESSFFANSVGIGTDSISDPSYKLFVASGIRTRKIKVDIAAWPDFVFESNYQLMPIKEVSKYIELNKHLPGINSAAEISKNGLDVGENQAALLKKIEELTLYIIKQDKELDALHSSLDSQEKKINQLIELIKERN